MYQLNITEELFLFQINEKLSRAEVESGTTGLRIGENENLVTA